MTARRLHEDTASPPATTRSGSGGYRPLSTRDGSNEDLWRTIALFGVLAVPGAMLAMVAGGEPYLAAAIASPGLLVLAIPLLRRLAHSDEDPAIAWILLVGLELRLLASIPRWQDAVDASAYVRVGRDLAVSFRAGNMTVDTGRSIPGTGSIRYLTGLTQVAFNDNAEMATIFFALLGFLGCVLVYLAAAAAFPGTRLRYLALALCLWPSLVYWPSSIGKEAVVLLGIGVTALGAAKRFNHSGGTALLLMGSAITGLVRPHITLLLLGSLLLAVVLRSEVRQRQSLNFGKYFLIALILVGLSMTAEEATELVATADLEEAAGYLEERTTQGGSAFEPATVKSPLDYPWAVITVMARPFPWEASSRVALVTSLEGALILVLGVVRLPHLLALMTRLRRNPLAGMAIFYLLAFFYAFSSFGNFGLLARQRTQALPFLLLALASPRELSNDRDTASGQKRRRRGAIGWGADVAATDAADPRLVEDAPAGTKRWRPNTLVPAAQREAKESPSDDRVNS